jgi:hypothetical protein
MCRPDFFSQAIFLIRSNLFFDVDLSEADLSMMTGWPLCKSL